MPHGTDSADAPRRRVPRGTAGRYNTRDVDDFIERIAGSVGHLNERVARGPGARRGGRARLIDCSTRSTSCAAVPRPPRRRRCSETDETLRRTLVLAQRTADATIKEAKEEANRVLSEAREEAARTPCRGRGRGPPRRRLGAGSSAEAEVETLLVEPRQAEGRPRRCSTRRLDEQRNQLRSGITEMQRLLDDPTALKPLAAGHAVRRRGPRAAAAGAAPLESRVPPGDRSAAEQRCANGRIAGRRRAPFGPGAQVAALQEPPARRRPTLGPPTQPVPFAVTGDGARPVAAVRAAGHRRRAARPGTAPRAARAMQRRPDARSPTPTAGRATWGKAVFDPTKAEAEARPTASAGAADPGTLTSGPPRQRVDRSTPHRTARRR